MTKKLLIIGFVWPEPKSTAAGIRMIQLIETFQNAGYTITFASSSTKNNNAFNLESIGVDEVAIQLNNSSFDVFIKTLKPDVVLFDRFMIEEQFGWRVVEHCNKALRILDTEDLHGLRKARQQAFKDNKPIDSTYLFNDTAKREIASIYRCDLSLLISEAEIELLINQFEVPASLLVYLPFMLNTVEAKTSEMFPKCNQRNHFVTIGNFLHEPNYDAILYLKSTIWPLIKSQLPNAELHIYGAYASQKITQLENVKAGFFIKGFAQEVNHVMQQARVCLAPIRFGAGLKGKLIDAMQNGTPSVTTSIGAEGLYGAMQAGGFIENNPQEFANKAVELFQNETIWKEKQANGFKVVEQRFNKATFQDQFLNHVAQSIQELKKNRLQNFTGQMLLHQTMQSTKYMSKWIEEKNKN